jgi:predicted nicotinamide N-methyase
MSELCTSTVYIPVGAPTFLHLHVKKNHSTTAGNPQLATDLLLNQDYSVQLSATDEMDMYISENANNSKLPAVVGRIILMDHLNNLLATQNSLAESRDNSTADNNTFFSLNASQVQTIENAMDIIVNSLSMVTNPSFNALQKNGKVQFKFCLSFKNFSKSQSSTALGTIQNAQTVLDSYNAINNTKHELEFYLHWEVVDSKFLPAVSGPHKIICGGKAGANNSAADNVLHAFFIPTANKKGLSEKLIVIRELCGIHLGGRIWDCAMNLKDYLLSSILNSNDKYKFHGKKLLELGSGTGVLGLWLAKWIQSNSFRNEGQSKLTQFLLTDQEEAMELLTENIRRNNIQPSALNSCPVETLNSRLEFGSSSDVKALNLIPPFDVVIGSDVIFNPVYYDGLLATLAAVSCLGTHFLFAYRPRSVDPAQDKPFFSKAKSLGIHFQPKAKYHNVYILEATRTLDNPTEN